MSECEDCGVVMYGTKSPRCALCAQNHARIKAATRKRAQRARDEANGEMRDDQRTQPARDAAKQERYRRMDAERNEASLPAEYSPMESPLYRKLKHHYEGPR